MTRLCDVAVLAFKTSAHSRRTNAFRNARRIFVLWKHVPLSCGFPVESPYTPLHNNEQCVRHVYTVAKRGRDRGARRKQKRLRVQAAETPVRAGADRREEQTRSLATNGSQTVGRPSSFGRRAYRGYRGPCRVRTHPCGRRDGHRFFGLFARKRGNSAVVTAAAENHWFGRCAVGRPQHSPANAPTAVPKQSPRDDGRANVTRTRPADYARARVTGRYPRSYRSTYRGVFRPFHSTSDRVSSVLFYVRSRVSSVHLRVFFRKIVSSFPWNPPQPFARLQPSVSRARHPSRRRTRKTRRSSAFLPGEDLGRSPIYYSIRHACVPNETSEPQRVYGVWIWVQYICIYIHAL